MILRRQLPVYSPLTFGATVAAAAGLVRGTGAVSKALEQQLLDWTGASAVILTDSGTSALSLAIQASTKKGPVALPAYGCYDLATAADGARADVLLYDVDPVTLNPVAASLVQALRAGAASVVVASLHGVPIDLDAILPLAKEHGAMVIEDAAQGVGMAWRGRPAGTTAPMGIFSFGRGKGVTGGGGALLLNDAEARTTAATLAPARRQAGVNQVIALLAQWALARPAFFGMMAALPLGIGETTYKPVHPPRLASRASCAAVQITFPLGLAEVGVRRRNAARLLAAVGTARGFESVISPEWGEPSWLRLPILAARDSAPFLESAPVSLGVMPGYPRALCDLPGFSSRISNGSDPFPGARTLAARLGTLPTHSRLTESDLRRLTDWLSSAS